MNNIGEHHCHLLVFRRSGGFVTGRVLRRSAAHLAAIAAAGHVFLLVAFIAPTGPLSLEGFLVVWVIPVLLFVWIGHTARAITSDVDVTACDPTMQ
jgi:hypothetical protein